MGAARRPAPRPRPGPAQHQDRGQPVAGPVQHRGAGAVVIAGAGAHRACRPTGWSSRSPRRRCCRTPTRCSTTLHELQRARRAHLDGRFRHRLFVAELPAHLPVRQDQDRPVVRARSRPTRRCRGDRPRGRRPGREPRHGDDGRRRRDAEQLDGVRSEGCTEVQGKVYSMPVPAHQIVTLLELLSK